MFREGVNLEDGVGRGETGKWGLEGFWSSFFFFKDMLEESGVPK